MYVEERSRGTRKRCLTLTRLMVLTCEGQMEFISHPYTLTRSKRNMCSRVTSAERGEHAIGIVLSFTQVGAQCARDIRNSGTTKRT